MINELQTVSQIDADCFEVLYSDHPQRDAVKDWKRYSLPDPENKKLRQRKPRKKGTPKQQALFD